MLCFRTTKLNEDVEIFDDFVEERRRTTDSSIPRIYCEFCSANVTYIYVSHANKLHYDIISKVWIGCEECDQFFPNQVEITA